MIYSTTSNATLRTRLLRWTPPLVLSVVCCTLISHQASLSKMAQRLLEQANSTDLQHLEDQFVELEQAFLAIQASRNAVTLTEQSDLSAALNGRMTDLENSLASIEPQKDLQALEQRMQQMESRQKQPEQSSAPVKPTSSSRKPKKRAEPSFQIFGRELRGGESFLSVGPVGIRSLDQNRLMRVGESYSGWRLENFDEQFAVFVGDGVTHRLNIR